MNLTIDIYSYGEFPTTHKARATVGEKKYGVMSFSKKEVLKWVEGVTTANAKEQTISDEWVVPENGKYHWLGDSTMQLRLDFFPSGTNPLDIAAELNREHAMDMLVWDGQDYHTVRLICGDTWDFAQYSGHCWPDGCAREFPKHWRFAILNPPQE